MYIEQRQLSADTHIYIYISDNYLSSPNHLSFCPTIEPFFFETQLPTQSGVHRDARQYSFQDLCGLSDTPFVVGPRGFQN